MNIQKIVTLHFHFAVWLSIACGIAAFNHPERVLSDDEGLYGPLRNNLLFAVGYLLLGPFREVICSHTLAQRQTE